MKKHIITTLIIGLIAASSLRAEPAAPLPPELKELDRTVGTWKVVEFVSKVAEWTPTETRTSGQVATSKPIFSGRYVEDRGADHVGIWSYDEVAKVFRYSYFGDAGNRHEFTFRWDAAKQSFIGIAPMDNGITFGGEIHFADAKTKEWHLKATDTAGKVYLDIGAKETRTDK